MNISKYTLTENDLNDFQVIFQKLNFSIEILINLFGVKKENSVKKFRTKVQITSEIPLISDFPTFKKWILKQIEDLERIL